MAPNARLGAACVSHEGDAFRYVRELYDSVTAADNECGVLAREAAQPADTNVQGDA